jgi:hypothetical protein
VNIAKMQKTNVSMAGKLGSDVNFTPDETPHLIFISPAFRIFPCRSLSVITAGEQRLAGKRDEKNSSKTDDDERLPSSSRLYLY